MAGDTRSLFESGDGLDLALAAKQRVARAEAEQFDLLLAYLAEDADVPLDGGSASPAGERLHAYGGSGTPKVPEFAGCEIAAGLAMSPLQASILIGDILDLAYRLPRLYNALHTGAVDAWRVRKVASATREFTMAQADRVDRRLSADTVGDGTPMLCRVTLSRLRKILDQIRTRTRPDDDDDQRRANHDQREITIRPFDSGVSALSGTLSSADGERLDQRLEQIVGWLIFLGDDRPKRVLRSVAVGWLADPDSLDLLYADVCRQRASSDVDAPDQPNESAAPETTMAEPEPDRAERRPSGPVPAAFDRRTKRRLLPSTVLYLHCDRASDTWSIDGVGPISRAEAIDLLGHSSVTIKPVINLAANFTYTGYFAPPKLREQTALQHAGSCSFPFCTRPSRPADYDHVVNFADGGRTDSCNGHRLCRFHHRTKTFADWTVHSPSPGIAVWQSPKGRTYLVTAGTTTRLDTRLDRIRRRERPNAA